MTDIPDQTNNVDHDPAEIIKTAFERAFPYLKTTQVTLTKGVEEFRDAEGWVTVTETGAFICELRAVRKG